MKSTNNLIHSYTKSHALLYRYAKYCGEMREKTNFAWLGGDET